MAGFIYKTSIFKRINNSTCKLIEMPTEYESKCIKVNERRNELIVENNKSINEIMNNYSGKQVIDKISNQIDNIKQAKVDETTIKNLKKYLEFSCANNKEISIEELHIKGYEYFVKLYLKSNISGWYSIEEYDNIFIDLSNAIIDRNNSKILNGFDLNNQKVKTFLSGVGKCLAKAREVYYEKESKKLKSIIK